MELAKRVESIKLRADADKVENGVLRSRQKMVAALEERLFQSVSHLRPTVEFVRRAVETGGRDRVVRGRSPVEP